MVYTKTCAAAELLRAMTAVSDAASQQLPLLASDQHRSQQEAWSGMLGRLLALATSFMDDTAAAATAALLPMLHGEGLLGMLPRLLLAVLHSHNLARHMQVSREGQLVHNHEYCWGYAISLSRLVLRNVSPKTSAHVPVMLTWLSEADIKACMQLAQLLAELWTAHLHQRSGGVSCIRADSGTAGGGGRSSSSSSSRAGSTVASSSGNTSSCARGACKNTPGPGVAVHGVAAAPMPHGPHTQPRSAGHARGLVA